MTDINRVVLVGRLVRDLGNDQRDFAYTPNGQARANISIAVNRSRKQGDQWVDEANFFDVTIWGKTAENLKPYLTKGKQIAVEGYLRQDRWEWFCTAAVLSATCRKSFFWWKWRRIFRRYPILMFNH